MNQIRKDHPENRTWWGKCWQLYGLLKCSLILTYSLRQECCPHLLHCSFRENAQCGKIIRKSGIIMAVWPREPLLGTQSHCWAHRDTARHTETFPGAQRHCWEHRDTAGHQSHCWACRTSRLWLDNFFSRQSSEKAWTKNHTTCLQVWCVLLESIQLDHEGVKVASTLLLFPMAHSC